MWKKDKVGRDADGGWLGVGCAGKTADGGGRRGTVVVGWTRIAGEETGPVRCSWKECGSGLRGMDMINTNRCAMDDGGGVEAEI